MFEESIIPQIRIEIDKQEITNLYGVRDIQINKNSSSPSTCDILLVNSESIQLNEGITGLALELWVSQFEEPLFRGFISGYKLEYTENGDRVCILQAYDSLINLRFKQNFSKMNGKNLSAIIRDAYPEIKPTGNSLLKDFKWENLHSFQESDLDFLKRISSEIGLYFYMNNDQLEFYTLDSKQKKQAIIKRDNKCKKVKIEFNSLSELKAIEATTWDLQDLKLLKTSESNGKGDSVRVDELHGNNKKELKTYSKARLLYNKALKTLIDLSVTGDVSFYPGVELVFEDGNSKYSGVINSVKHTIDSKNGFLTHISTKPIKRQKRDLHLNATLAKITNVNDPDKKGRVKVMLPSISNYETDWLPVMIPGGGKDRGLYTLPSKGDMVYISFINGDISKGVILGGIPGDELHGSDSYTLSINKKQQIRINRKKNSIEIENMGSKISMRDSKVEFLSKENLDISAPGKVINIKGRSINFVRG